MVYSYRGRYAALADPEPVPGPTPIPVRLVRERSRSRSPPLPIILDKPTKRDDDFYPTWDAFQAKASSRAASITRLARRTKQVQKAANKDKSGLTSQTPTWRPYEQAAAECKARVESIVKECKRLNRKFRDREFDIETGDDTLHALNGHAPDCFERVGPPPWIKRIPEIFDEPKFFIDGASADEVIQGNGGDCWFLAALMGLSAKPELISRLCVARDEKCGVYGFVFYRDGQWVPEVVDDRLFLRVGDEDELVIVKNPGETSDHTSTRGSPRVARSVSIKYDMEKLRQTLQKGGEALYFARCRTSETWLPLIEKAYAKAHGDYKAIEGGWVGEGVEDLTGGVAVTLNPEDIMDKDEFWQDLLQVNKAHLFGGSSQNSELHGVVGSHAYTILQAWEEDGLRLLRIKNPWGEKEWDGAWSDGSDKWTPEMMLKLQHRFGDDGIFWMNYEDFLKHFPTINRTRIFGPEWTVTQQWTSVNVPWTPDYLDTKFQLTVKKKGPVVIVLCQPDERYFVGLAGRYFYSLHFRVYADASVDGEDHGPEYLVRSMHNSGGDQEVTRSVSTEIELEPGTYSIVIKVTPIRESLNITAAERIKATCTTLKEKLLVVGRNYDLAQSKGRRREREMANKRAEEDGNRNKIKAGERHQRAQRNLEKERAQKRESRIKKAMNERREDPTKPKKERSSRKQHAGTGGEPLCDQQPCGGKNADDEGQANDRESISDDRTVNAASLSNSDENAHINSEEDNYNTSATEPRGKAASDAEKTDADNNATTVGKTATRNADVIEGGQEATEPQQSTASTEVKSKEDTDQTVVDGTNHASQEEARREVEKHVDVMSTLTSVAVSPKDTLDIAHSELQHFIDSLLKKSGADESDVEKSRNLLHCLNTTKHEDAEKIPSKHLDTEDTSNASTQSLAVRTTAAQAAGYKNGERDTSQASPPHPTQAENKHPVSTLLHHSPPLNPPINCEFSDRASYPPPPLSTFPLPPGFIHDRAFERNPAEEESRLDDDDFPWDSDMDGSGYVSSDEDAVQDLHGEDKWNAICVLGLRVYSLGGGVGIEVVGDGS